MQTAPKIPGRKTLPYRADRQDQPRRAMLAMRSRGAESQACTVLVIISKTEITGISPVDI
jgi:hypothetical protein